MCIVNVLSASTGNFYSTTEGDTIEDSTGDDVTLSSTTSGRLVVGATYTNLWWNNSTGKWSN